MSSALAFIPQDRRQALAGGHALPDAALGVVLFADISGFTPLTNAYIASLGPQRGVEAATRGLNVVYTALIAALDQWGGSVVGFSGDGMTCWFGPVVDGAGLTRLAQTALHAATALHDALLPHRTVQVDAETTVELGIKIALAAGRVRRFVVGDPAIQLIDVIGGLPVDLTGMGEQLAMRGETLVASSMLPYLPGVPTGDRRMREGRMFALIPGLRQVFSADPNGSPASSAPIGVTIAAEQVRPWLLPDVADRLATVDERFWAELRPGVALFVRFTGLDYDRDPAVAHLLDTFIRRVQAIVHRLEGALIQVTTGDKGSYLYAAFGATKSHPDDAARAVAASVEILHDEVARAQVYSMQVGLAAGRMRTGAYGSPTRRTFGAQGAAVNLAARLMMAAPAGAIFVTEGLAGAVRDRFEVAFFGDLALKGMAAPMPVYQVVGASAHLPRIVLLEKPLIGRGAELAQLDAALRRAQDGAGAWLELVGPAGIGKSALLHGLAAMGNDAGASVVLVEADAIRGHESYQTVGELLRRSLAACSGLNLNSSDAQPLFAWAAEHDPGWLPRLPLLRDVLGLDLPDTPVTLGLTPELRQAALASLMGELFVALAAARPLLLLIDNGQWLDEASQAILAQMGLSLAAASILLVGTARTGAGLAWGEVGPTRIPIGTLTSAETAALVEQLLEPSVDPLITGLIDRVAQGNPYVAGEAVAFLRSGGHVVLKEQRWSLSEEYTATLRAARILIYEQGAWGIAPDVDRSGALPGVPDSLHGLLLARFDRLPDGAKLTLKIAGVIGRQVDTALLAIVHPSGQDAPLLRDTLAQLVQEEMLMPAPEEALLSSVRAYGAVPDGPAQLVFRHTLMQEVVYDTLLHSQQQELHAAVAHALEAHAPAAVERLAHHYGAADMADSMLRAKAIQYIDLAAAKHEREFANETALQLVTRLMDLAPEWSIAARRIRLLHILARREEESAALEQAQQWQSVAGYELPLWQSRYYEHLSRYNAAHQAAATAYELAPPDDVRGQVECLVQQANVAGREGDYAVEAARYEAALVLVENARLDAPTIVVDLYYGLGIVQREQGQYDKAISAFTHALEMAKGEGLLNAEAKIRTALGFTTLQQRRFDVALEHTEAALHLRRMIGDRRGEGDSLSSLAQVLIHGFGDHLRAREMLLEALALQRSIGNRWSMILNLNELGVLHLMIGQYHEAEPYLRDALDLCREIGSTIGMAHVNCNLGLVLRELGELARAESSLVDALAAAEMAGDPQIVAQIRSEIGQVALARGDWTTAKREATCVCTILDELDLRVMSTPDLLTQARAALYTGDMDAAAELAQAAWGILAACGGQGPDFPQRDAYYCAEVFAVVGEMELARQALGMARQWLDERAERIRDGQLREAYRHAVAVHAAILAATDLAPSPAAADRSHPHH